jgi:APA family basic amino acid/polyamine antiporter
MTSVTAQGSSRGELLRILGVSFGVAIAVGGMIGAGILRAPSLIAAEVPNAGLILALWAIAAVHAGLQGNVLCELGTSVPRAGGFYVYVYRAFGDVGGLVVGWSTWLQRLASTAALSVSFADFLAQLWPQTAGITPVTAVAMQLAVFGLNMIGLRQGRTFQQVTSLLKALALIAFCVVAVLVASKLRAATPAVSPAMSAVGWLGLIGAYQLIVGAYGGWYEPAFFTEEDVTPGRSLPRAIAISLVLTALLYLAVNASLLYALGVQGVARTALPFTTVLSAAGGSLPAIAFAIGAMVTVVSCANAGIMTAPRILLALSRDKLLPGAFQYVSKGGSPNVGYVLTAAGSIALALSGSFGLVFGLIATLGTIAFILVVASIFVLRRREPELVRPYRAKGYPYLPAFVLVIDLVLLGLFLRANWLGGVYAAVMFLLCIPFALVARRARQRTVA